MGKENGKRSRFSENSGKEEYVESGVEEASVMVYLKRLFK